MRTHKSHRGVLRDRRGAVMVEGVIVLPIFVIIFAATVYFHRLYAHKLDNSTKARTCAWEYAVHGCDTVPDGCPSMGKSNFTPKDNGATNPVEGAFSRTNLNAASGSDGQLNKNDGALSGLNKLGLSLLQLDEGFTATPSSDVTRPSVLGGGTVSMSSSYTMMCNEKSRSISQLLKDGYCKVIGC